MTTGSTSHIMYWNTQKLKADRMMQQPVENTSEVPTQKYYLQG